MGFLGSTALFVPADKPDRALKAATLADIVIVDLEDAVAESSKNVAREAMSTVANSLDPAQTMVRLNSPSTLEFSADLAAVVSTNLTTCMVAKAESPKDILSVSPLNAVALIETPRGVLNCSSIAAVKSCVGLMFGSEDLALSLSATHSRFGGELIGVLQTARHLILLAARGHGVLAIDSAFVELDDDAGLGAEALQASVMGFDLKACVHPRQLPIVRRAFSPSAADVVWAEKVVEAASNSSESVFALDGAMIDAPIIRRAEAILRRFLPQ